MSSLMSQNNNYRWIIYKYVQSILFIYVKLVQLIVYITQPQSNAKV